MIGRLLASNVNHFWGAVEHKQWCVYRQIIFSACASRLRGAKKIAKIACFAGYMYTVRVLHSAFTRQERPKDLSRYITLEYIIEKPIRGLDRHTPLTAL